MIEYAPLSPKKLTIHEAWLYCLTLNHDGHKDWRMPTTSEFLSDSEIPINTFDDDVSRIFLKYRYSYSRKVKPVRDI